MAVQTLLPNRYANLLPARNDGGIIPYESPSASWYNALVGRSVPTGWIQTIL